MKTIFPMHSFSVHSFSILLLLVLNSMGFRQIAAAACVDPDLSKIPKWTSVTLCDGSKGAGSFVYPGDCVEDGQIGCIAKGAFKAADITAISPFDLRNGLTIAGVIEGKAKHCRNGMNTALYNYDGAAGTVPNGATTAGSVPDWWDTIDDLASDPIQPGTFGAPTGPNGWNSDHLCDGSQITDVSSTKAWLTPSNLPLYCSSSGTATCTNADSRTFSNIFYEAYTGLYLTNSLIADGGSAALGTDWAEAVKGCAALNSGDGVGKWRLPTQKEAMSLYIGGIFLRNTDLFSGHLSNLITFWTATTDSTLNTNAWYIQFFGGRTMPTNTKTNLFSVICVR